MSKSGLPFRPELQGLRAVAVLAVLLYHIWPQIFSGGFVGVDIFFVISGFLITNLLLLELEKENRIHIMRFWARRMLRLLPAASIVLMASLVASMYFLPETDWLNIAKQVFSSALYVQNWYLDAQAVDYLRQHETATPVQHYWSLSIEEQYYALWPLLLYFGGKWFPVDIRARKIFVMVLVFALFASSLAYSVFWSGVAAEGYFKTASRIWELSAGALLAVFVPKREFSPTINTTLGWIGFVAIISASLLIDENTRFPGYIALWPIIGTTLLIAAGNTRWAPSVFLSRQPLRFLGDISYSIYLWHWPLVVFINRQENITSSLKPFIIIIFSLFLAVLTKFLIEDVFRDEGKKPLKIKWAYAFSLLLIVTTASFAGKIWYREHLVIQAILAKENALREQPAEYPGAAAFDPINPVVPPAGLPMRPDPRTAAWDMNKEHLRCMGNTGKMQIEICEFGKLGAPFRVILAGDSHAMHYGPALQKIAEVRNWHLYIITKPACLLGNFQNRQKGQVRYDCENWKKTILSHIEKTKPQFLITSGALSALYDDLPPIRRQIEGYQSYWRKIENLGTKLIVVKGTPLMRDYNTAWMNPAACLLQYKNPAKCNRPRKFVLDAFHDPMVMAAEAMGSVSVIDLTRYLCDAETCYPVVGNVLAYRDSNHLTETFIRTLMPYLDKELLKIKGFSK